MKILALDLSSKTGWATNVNGQRSGIVEFALKRGESPGMRFLRCRAWLNEMLQLLGGSLDVLAYEMPPRRPTAAMVCRLGLVAEVQAFAAENNIELLEVHSSQLKEWRCGAGRAEADARLLVKHARTQLAHAAQRAVQLKLQFEFDGTRRGNVDHGCMTH